MSELTAYIHYHEYDHNHQYPTLVIQGDGATSGFNISKDGAEIKEKTCICAATHEGECCCSYDWKE